MSVDISVSITEDVVDIIATPTVNIVNVTNSASIDPGLYDLSEFTNTSPNPFVRASGLSSYVPTSRTLTINGVTQDLSANRTFTISTGITIGSTAIASGTVGRVLFEGAGNVVQESSSLFWDNTNARLGIGTSTPITAVEVKKTGSDSWITASRGTNSFHAGFLFNPSGSWTASNVLWNFGLYANTNDLRYWTYNGSTDTFVLNLFGSTANVGIGTTTDAGFKLDVNGTARVSGVAYFSAYSTSVQRLQFNNGNVASNIGYISGVSDGVIRLNNAAEDNFTRLQFGGGTTSFPSLQRSGSALAVMDATGTALTNLLVGTTTDAGFRLDVNGTARVKGTGTTSATNALSIQDSAGANTLLVKDDKSVFLSSLTTGGATSVTDQQAGRLYFESASQWHSYIGSTRNSGTGDTSLALFGLGTGGQYHGGIRFFTSSNSATPVLAMIVDRNQSVGIGLTNSTNLTVNSSAKLQVDSTTQGFLPPRMTTTQINAIASPAEGLMVYNTTISHMCVYQAGSWVKLSHSPM